MPRSGVRHHANNDLLTVMDDCPGFLKLRQAMRLSPVIALIMLGCSCNSTDAQLVEMVSVNGKEVTEQVTTYQIDFDGDGTPDIQEATATKTVASRDIPGKLIVINTEAANVRVSAEDADRNPVQLSEVQPNKYLVSTPGKYWVRVTAIDFEKNIFAEETRIVELNGPQPPPDPEGPFDAISSRVSKAAQGIDAEELGQVFASVAERMERMEILRIADANIVLNKGFAKSSSYRPIMDLLVKDAKGRTIGREAAIEYYREVAKGLGIK